MSKTEWDIAICGLNCAKCGLLETGKCAGCRGPADKHWSADCGFLACTRVKGLRYCFECDELPCEKLTAFANDGYEHHRITVENLKRMREIGLEAWLEQQERPSFCPGWTP